MGKVKIGSMQEIHAVEMEEIWLVLKTSRSNSEFRMACQVTSQGIIGLDFMIRMMMMCGNGPMDQRKSGRNLLFSLTGDCLG